MARATPFAGLRDGSARVDLGSGAAPASAVLGDAEAGVVVNIACAGAYDAIKAGVQRFRASRFGKAAQVDVEGEDGDGDDNQT